MTNEMELGPFTVLSIDAWRDGQGWTWNAWYKVGTIPRAVVDYKPRQLFKAMRDAGFLSDASKGRVALEDDGFNIVILARGTQKPLFAIEYGNHE